MLIATVCGLAALSLMYSLKKKTKKPQKPVGQAFKSFGAKLNKPSDQLVFDHLS